MVIKSSPQDTHFEQTVRRRKRKMEKKMTHFHHHVPYPQSKVCCHSPEAVLQVLVENKHYKHTNQQDSNKPQTATHPPLA